MRFLLLLSALLSAMVGSGAYARPTCVQTHQVDGRGGVEAPRVAETAQARRPATELPKVVDALDDTVQVDPAADAAVNAPLYSMRLRV